MLCSWYLQKALNELGALAWFEIVWSYSVEAIHYWIIFSMKMNNIKTKKCTRFWGHSWHWWKMFSKSNLIKFISQFLELRCGKCWFFNGFCCYKFKQIAKIEFGKKIQFNFQCVHTWANSTCYINNNLYIIFWIKSSLR